MKQKPLIILFGSQARKSAGARSDTDVAVLAERPLSLAERSRLSESIARRLHVNEDLLDLVDLSSASPLLKFQVAREGKLVLGEPYDFIRFKVRAVKEYQDTAKFRRMRERVLAKYHAP